MNKNQILKRLCNDEDYYGEFGNQFLSNSHVGRLLKDPLRAFEPSKPSPAFLVGGYFHTCILEPDKLEKFRGPLAEFHLQKAIQTAIQIRHESLLLQVLHMPASHSMRVLKTQVPACHFCIILASYSYKELQE